MHNTTRSMHTRLVLEVLASSSIRSCPFPRAHAHPPLRPLWPPAPQWGPFQKMRPLPCPAGSLLSVAKLSGVGVYDHGCSFGL